MDRAMSPHRGVVAVATALVSAGCPEGSGVEGAGDGPEESSPTSSVEALLPSHTLRAPNPGEFDFFGAALAADGDTILVGAPYRTVKLESGESLPRAGLVFVWLRESGTWRLQQELRAPNPRRGGLFGRSVDLEGDIAIVGAPLDGQGTGEAYIYAREGEVWSVTSQLHPKNVPDDLAERGLIAFGTSVSVAGPTAAVGSSEAARSLSTGRILNNVGAVYIFEKNGSEWDFEARLVAEDREASDRFGDTVAVDGNRVLVGAYNKSPVIPPAVAPIAQGGAVFLFEREVGGWSLAQGLVANDVKERLFFGLSLALLEETIVISDPRNVYFFTLDAIRSSWQLGQKASLLLIPGQAGGASSGEVIDLVEDAMVVTTRREALVFTRDQDTWVPYRRLVGPPGAMSFSISAAAVSDKLVAVSTNRWVQGVGRIEEAHVFPMF